MNMLGLQKSGAALIVSWNDAYVFPTLQSTVSRPEKPGQRLTTMMLLRRLARSVRLTPLGKGDWNTIAAGYRRLAEQKGLAVTLREKIRRNRHAERLIGAANVKLWTCLHDNYQDMYRDAKSWDPSFIEKRSDGSLIQGGRWLGGRAFMVCAPKQFELATRPQNLPAIQKLFAPWCYFHNLDPTGLGATVIPFWEMVYHDCQICYGKYGYAAQRSAEYVAHHVLCARPLHYHSIPDHRYWTDHPAGQRLPHKQSCFARTDDGWAARLHPTDAFLKTTQEVLGPLHQATAFQRLNRLEFLTAARPDNRPSSRCRDRR